MNPFTDDEPMKLSRMSGTRILNIVAWFALAAALGFWIIDAYPGWKAMGVGQRLMPTPCVAGTQIRAVRMKAGDVGEWDQFVITCNGRTWQVSDWRHMTR